MKKTKLSKRNYEIAGLISKAKSNKQIAAEMGMTEGTIKTYVLRLFQQAKAVNRVELAVRFERGEFTC
jgi:two-component system, NarL family, nitrate/nitrite response regulator NarL